MLDLALSNGLRLSAENAQPTKSGYPERNRENRNYVLVGPPQILTRAYTPRPRGKLRASELPQMNKTVEFFLTALALCGLYCAIPSSNEPSSPVIRTEQAVILADGSDPMPLCRKGKTVCKP